MLVNFKLKFSVLLLALLSALAQAEKYERAMIFAGGQLATAVHIGMYDAAIDAGWIPDLLIGSCGGAMGAAVIHAYPERTERLNYIYGKEFHDLYNGMIRMRSMGKAISVLKEMGNLEKDYPNIFDKYVLDIANYSNSHLDTLPINKRPRSDSPSILIVAGKLLRGREIVGQKTPLKNIFREVYFTDERTAEKIKNIESPYYNMQAANTFIDRQVEIKTDMTLYPAVRASGADPFLSELPHYDNEQYITGAINIHPVELASQIAHDIIMRYPPNLPEREFNYLKGIFGFNGHVRAREVGSSNLVNTWVDLTDWDDHYDNFGFFPHFSFKKMIMFQGFSDDGIPDNHNKFIEKIKTQYEYGYNRMIEAFAAKRNSPDAKSHVRQLTYKNDRFQNYLKAIEDAKAFNEKIRLANRGPFAARGLIRYRGKKPLPMPNWADFEFK